MSPFPLTPQVAADLLILGFFAVQALRARRTPAPAPGTDRGSTLVFWGCYATALLSLNVPTPTAPVPPIAWIGVIAAACGLGAWIATTAAGMPGTTLQHHAAWRYADRLSVLVMWVGATAASGNLIAVLTVAVAMLAATVVLLSAEAAGSRHPASGRRWRRPEEG